MQQVDIELLQFGMLVVKVVATIVVVVCLLFVTTGSIGGRRG